MGTWPVKVPDLSWADWRYALEECVAAGDRVHTARRLEARWSGAGDALACLSVRSAFDLLLRAAPWEAGDEIVFTVPTIPDMARIARLHGLRPVPLDVDPRTVSPDPAELAERVGPRTRAVVAAHLFGGRCDLTPLVEGAHRRGLLFVEDCAQAYHGPRWTGHEGSDVTLFSFGPWKTATALGGGLARVKPAELRDRLRALAERDPVQSTGDYVGSVLSAGGMKLAGDPGSFGMFVDVVRTVGMDHRSLVGRLTKGYRGPGFERRIRQRPSAPLLAVLERRLDEGEAPVRRREAPAATLLSALGPEVEVPGSGLPHHGWWMVPVTVAAGDRRRFMAALLEAGFDCSPGRLAVVGDDGRAPGARRLLTTSVFVPFGPKMPETELRRLGRTVRRTLGLPPIGSPSHGPDSSA